MLHYAAPLSQIALSRAVADAIQPQVDEESSKAVSEDNSSRIPAVFESRLPSLIAEADSEVQKRFLEFFAAQIRNKNTRRAYGRAVGQFLSWAGRQGFFLESVTPMVISAYVEQHDGSPATVKQHLSALRQLFDWLQSGGVLDTNPAEPVKGPKHIQREGSTPILTAEEATEFIEGLPTESIKDKRDKAIIGVLTHICYTYTFARVSAIARMKRKDYYQAGRRWKVRLREKGGKQRDVPLHHKAKDYLDAYLEAIPGEADGESGTETSGDSPAETENLPLFRI